MAKVRDIAANPVLAQRYGLGPRKNFKSVSDAANNPTSLASSTTGIDINAPAVEGNGAIPNPTGQAVVPATPAPPMAQAPAGASQDASGNITMAPVEASAAAPAGAQTIAQGDADIDATHARLLQIMNSVPGIDYEGKYKQLLNQTQNAPIPQAPGKMQSFFAALGSPSEAPNALMQAHGEAARAAADKMDRVLSLKEAILHGDIQQQIAKGDMKKALAQSAELEKLHAHQLIAGQSRAYEMFKKQQDVLQGNRVELANMGHDAALARVREMIQGRADLAALSPKDKSAMEHEFVTQYGMARSTMGMDDVQATDWAKSAVMRGRNLAQQFSGGGNGGATPHARADGKVYVKRANGAEGWLDPSKRLPTDTDATPGQ
jgi:hypothetical protein